MDLNFDKRVAWVTGGSRGIGRAVALTLARNGCDVAISYHKDSDASQMTLKELEKYGVKCFGCAANIADEAAVETAYGTICENLGEPNILVNSAGITQDDLFLMMDSSSWQSVMNVNVMGVVNTSRICAKGMMGKRWGRIINISSAAATKGGRGQANYAASKGAVEAMSRSLAVELGGRGVTVNCIAPGVIETDMSAELIRLARSEILARQVIKRFGTPDEVAAWVTLLASDMGAFVTGQTIHIDGGLKMP